MPEIVPFTEILHTHPVASGLVICSLMVLAFIGAIGAWHPRHHETKHRPSRAAR
jgi:hypothetical protein